MKRILSKHTPNVRTRGCCGTIAQPATPHRNTCRHEAQRVRIQDARRRSKDLLRRGIAPAQAEIEPDWSGLCEACGQSPIVPLTGLCGPCTFGEADTYGGNW